MSEVLDIELPEKPDAVVQAEEVLDALVIPEVRARIERTVDEAVIRGTACTCAPGFRTSNHASWCLAR